MNKDSLYKNSLWTFSALIFVLISSIGLVYADSPAYKTQPPENATVDQDIEEKFETESGLANLFGTQQNKGEKLRQLETVNVNES